MANAPSKHEILEVFEIAKEATIAKRPTKELSKYEQWMDDVCDKLLSHQLIGFVIAIVLAVISAVWHDVELARTAFVTFTLSQLLGVILSIAVIAYSVPFVHGLFKDRFSQFMKLVESSTSFNLQYVEKLSNCNLLAVRYVLSHYEGERQAFEKRCGILVGSIEKIGFLPALAGLLTLSINLTKFNVLQSTANTLIGVVLAFYILSVGAFTMMQRQDRVIAILKYSLDAAK